MAKIAGIPKLIVEQAQKYLEHLESSKLKPENSKLKVEGLF